jgi:hypothetical protein
MDRALNAPAADWKDGIAGLMRAFINLKLLSTKRDHLRHERHPIQATSAVKSAEDLFLAANLDPITNAQLLFQ